MKEQNVWWFRRELIKKIANKMLAIFSFMLPTLGYLCQQFT